MIEETIQVIRETEAKAEALVKDAEVQCKKILEEASKEAESLKADKIHEIRLKADTMMADAKEQGAQSQKAALSEVENDIKSLKEAAASKEDEAVSLVMSQLV